MSNNGCSTPFIEVYSFTFLRFTHLLLWCWGINRLQGYIFPLLLCFCRTGCSNMMSSPRTHTPLWGPLNPIQSTCCQIQSDGSIIWFVVQTSLYRSQFSGAEYGNKRKRPSKPYWKGNRWFTTSPTRYGIHQNEWYAWRRNELGVCSYPSCLTIAWWQSSVSLNCLCKDTNVHLLSAKQLWSSFSCTM